MFQNIDEVIEYIDSDPQVQGHICVNNDKIFDYSINNEIYGFPGSKNASINNIKVTTWRSIASLNNIGPKDLIFLYRTSGESDGCQEFHGIFKAKTINGCPAILFHPKDNSYLPWFKENQYLPFRVRINTTLDNVLSIPNDLRNQNYRKNNNLKIIKAFSESDPTKDRLWGFRNISVMNIGAARKSSIVAISNKQTRFLSSLLKEGLIRKPKTIQTVLGQQKFDQKYGVSLFPSKCYLIDDSFISGKYGLEQYLASGEIDYEALIYAYIIRGFRMVASSFSSKLFDDFQKINTNIDLKKFSENCILEVVVTPHIQEEIDILLLDREEKNFLILEIKHGQIKQEDVEQAEKYIQLIKQKFPNHEKVISNVIGLRNSAVKNTEDVITAYYTITQNSSKTTHIEFNPN